MTTFDFQQMQISQETGFLAIKVIGALREWNYFLGERQTWRISSFFPYHTNMLKIVSGIENKLIKKILF